jgi:hypothetical protein
VCVLVKALAKNPDDRYQSMNDFAVALEKLARGDLSATVKIETKKDLTQESTVVEKMPTMMRTGQAAQHADSSRSGSSGWKRFLAMGLGGVAVVAIGICLVVAAILILQGNGSPSAPEPTAFVPYVEPTSPPVVVEPTSPPPPDPPTSAPVVVVPTLVVIQPTNPPSATAVPSCPGAKYPTRLTVNFDARVCTKSERLIVRAATNRNATERISIYPGVVILLMKGPTCDDDSWWWFVEVKPGAKVSNQNRSAGDFWFSTQVYRGWVREGPRHNEQDEDKYYLCQGPQCNYSCQE